MRTVTKIYNVYTYPELSEEAKERVKQWYLDDPYRSESFSEIYTEDLRYIFPNSDLKTTIHNLTPHKFDFLL